MGKKKALTKQERVDTLFHNISILAKIIYSNGSIIAGVDPGRSSPGIAFVELNNENSVKKFSTNTKLKGFGKVIEVESWIVNHLSNHPPALIVMEDYAFDSEFGREKAGELGGVIKRAIWLRGIPLITVAPQSLKAYIGVMKKEEIMKEVFRKWGINTAKSDEADAVVLAKIGIGIFKIVSHGITIADNDTRKAFEASAHKFVNLEKNEAKTLVNLLTNRGDAADEFARGKEKARKTVGKQEQGKEGKEEEKGKDSGSKTRKNPDSKTRKDSGSNPDHRTREGRTMQLGGFTIRSARN